MVEAVMFWNEPNNASHWDFQADPGWVRFAELVRQATTVGVPQDARTSGCARRGGRRSRARLSARLESLADRRLAGAVSRDLGRDRQAVWVSEVGASSFGADEVQAFGLQRSVALLAGRVPRVHWYSLFDLPRAWPATTRHREAGLSWADSLRPGAAWFDCLMSSLEPFEATVTFCFPPESEGLEPHHTSPPREPSACAAFCARMVRRYAN